MVAKKDFNAPGHIDLHKIPNLQVIKACQSLTSRGYVKTQFSWQYYYYTLTNEGIGTLPHNLSATFPLFLALFSGFGCSLCVFVWEYVNCANVYRVLARVPAHSR